MLGSYYRIFVPLENDGMQSRKVGYGRRLLLWCSIYRYLENGRCLEIGSDQSNGLGGLAWLGGPGRPVHRLALPSEFAMLRCPALRHVLSTIRRDRATLLYPPSQRHTNAKSV